MEKANQFLSNIENFPKIFIKNNENNVISLDSRIELNGSTGTVKYIGPLIHKKDNDLWVGISWDEVTRGKHNGTVEGFEYFKSKGNSGSLIKLNKINVGLNFKEAMDFKYNFDNSDEVFRQINEANKSGMYLMGNKRKIDIEFVGNEKAYEKFAKSDICNVDLSSAYINKIDLDLNLLFPNIKQLVLHNTLINKWSEFLNIFFAFKNLDYLNFSGNVLTFDEQFEEKKLKLKDVNLNLNYLVLNKNCLTFSDLSKLSFILKSVKTLYLYNNNLSEVYFEEEDLKNKEITNNIKNLEVLSLEKNKIVNFSKTLKIFENEKLTNLNLNQNSLLHLSLKDNNALPLTFSKNLKSLWLDFNAISSEQIFEELSAFENLTDILLLNNRIVNLFTLDRVNYELIGRLLKLTSINHATISKEMRRDHEIMYLKASVETYVKKHSTNFQKETFEPFMQEHHPNYFYLKKKYFDPVEDYEVNKLPVSSLTIKGTMLNIKFNFDGKIINKSFPKTTSFANLKNLLSKLFKTNKTFSFYVTHGTSEELISDETKSLDNAGVKTNETITLK